MTITLASITGGKVMAPVKTTVMGPPGVGKTTFAAGAPSPIFLPVEEGTNSLDVQRFPQPATFEEALAAVTLLNKEEHKYKTLVIDTLDAMEPLVWRDVCEHGKKDSIEDFGYGKGYVLALERWRVMLACLENLRKAKRMNIVLVAHAQIKKFANPIGADYDRWDMKLAGKGASALFVEWSDALLFAEYETLTPTDDKDRVRAVSTGNRIARTNHAGGYEAKNRFGLPDPMPLDWAAYREALQSHFKKSEEVKP